MTKPGRCKHALVYEPSIGGYNIVCRKCGELRGGSESADLSFLTGLNRNQRLHDAAVKRAASRCKKPRPAATRAR